MSITYAPITVPTVVTGAAGIITATTVTVGGEVTHDGHAAVTARGIEYRVSGAGDYTAVAAGTGTGTFSAALTGLTPDTTYQARAYATNVIGTARGEVINFATAPISAAIAADQALTEANLNGRQITVTLSGTTFAATLTSGNFTLNDAPPGVDIASVSRVNDTTATLNLSYDGTDFDSNRNLGLTIAETALASGASLTAGNTLTITATNDPESIALTQVVDIWEGEEDGKVITVTLSGGTFSPVLNPANWTVGNLPAGVSKGTVTRVNATTVEIALSGNATAAYAGDITNVSVTLTTAEYDDSTGGGSLTASNGILLKAKTTPTVVTGTAGSITATTATVGGEVTGDGHEAVTARGVEYRVSGIGDYTAVAASTAGTGTFSVGLTGLTPDTTYQARAYATNAKGTAYGEVITFTTAPISADISADPALTEANLNGRQITVTLSGTTFAATLTAGNFTLNDVPPGVGIASISRVNDTTATLNLSYDGTDFDANRNLGVTIAAAALASGASLTAGNTLTITATDEPESIALTQAVDIWEGEEDGKVITVTLSGGTFSPVLTPANWTVSNLPAGVSKGTVTRVNATTVQINLSGNATAAYAGDINNVSVTLTTDEYDDSTGGGSLTASSGILLKARTMPTVVTGTAGSITATMATVGGEVTSDGHAAITARGIEYRVSGVGDYTALAAGSGTGTFSATLTGLTANTAYQARAYATNAKGSAYGEVINFTTRSSSSSGSSGPTAPAPTPSPAKVVIGDTAIAKETVTTPDGRTVETFTVQTKAQQLIEADKGKDASTIEIKVASTPSATTVVNVPSTVLQSAVGLNVAISTPNATLELPQALVAALAAGGKDLSITVERSDTVAISAQMSGVSGTDGAEVLGTPAVIETEVRGPVNVTLPLTGIAIPTAPAERQTLLDSLRVFAIHSDGEKKVITGTIIYDTNGNPVGISFSVDKFSTFAVIKVAVPAVRPGPEQVVKLTVGEVRATIGGAPYTLDAAPFVKPGVQRTLVPVRFVSESLGARVDWHEEARQVVITDGGTRIILTIGANEVMVNGTPTALDCPAEIVMPSGRTFIPLRFVSETLGAQVDWDAATQEITITR